MLYTHYICRPTIMLKMCQKVAQTRRQVKWLSVQDGNHCTFCWTAGRVVWDYPPGDCILEHPLGHFFSLPETSQ